MKLHYFGFLMLAIIIIFLVFALVGEKSHACGDVKEPEPFTIQVTEAV